MSRKGCAGLLSMVACLLVTACAGGSVRGESAVGDLGGDGQERPGDLYVRLAVEYLRQGQTETALRKAGDAVAEDPDNPQAHNLMALIYQRLGWDRLAEQHFRKAIGLGPGDPYILNAYASFLCNRRRFAQARSQYEKALANPRYATPWIAMTNLGICARHGGNGGQAETYFRRALSTNPRFGSALAALADLDYSDGRYRSAKTHLDRYFKVAQPTPQVLLLAIRVERKLGSRQRADTYAELLRKRYPDAPQLSQL
ncbi:type IV pilus biogenesis/stability protein PilW [Candidatus Thiosymbion oneisti]|uniref:type IV pilus biogenesis/stability protein PilW n=2 Tax=Candidatus Thiosymbion oneisti TaxID=589554 RepID=UPI001FB0F99E|nr:type IV pilus biogenesis/stability protein PilW [Candidatus Thiosymbion oneisti]